MEVLGIDVNRERLHFLLYGFHVGNFLIAVAQVGEVLSAVKTFQITLVAEAEGVSVEVEINGEASRLLVESELEELFGRRSGLFVHMKNGRNRSPIGSASPPRVLFIVDIQHPK